MWAAHGVGDPKPGQPSLPAGGGVGRTRAFQVPLNRYWDWPEPGQATQCSVVMSVTPRNDVTLHILWNQQPSAGI